MARTTPLGYPYPEDNDQVDVAGDIQSLAEAVDTHTHNGGIAIQVGGTAPTGSHGYLWVDTSAAV